MICATLMSREGALSISQGRLPATIRILGKVYPLDQQMRIRIREQMGLPKDFGKKEDTEGYDTREEVEEYKERLQEAIQFDKVATIKAANHGTL